MDAVFLKLLNMSITASWLILAIVVLRVLLKKAPKAILCVLWALVGIRLVCPFSVESVLSLIPSSETVSPDIVYSHAPVISSGVPAINHAINPIISSSFTPGPAESANPLQIWISAASIVWIAGVAALLLYGVISYLRLRRRVNAAMPLRDTVWLCDEIKTPFILGIVNPRIYLLSDIDEQKIGYVVAHENAHLKRRDHWWKLLSFALLSVYWFNPLMWLAYILLCRDIELACDERVVKEMSIDYKKAYSNALLSCSVPRRMILACPLAFGEVGVKERIKTVLSYKKPAFWIIVAAIVACVVVAVCFLTNPKDGSNPYQWTHSVGVEDITMCSVTTWEDGSSFTPSAEQLGSLINALNAVPLRSITDGRGIPRTLSVMIQCGEREYRMNYAAGIAELSFDSETAKLYSKPENTVWQIQDNGLTAVLEELLVGKPAKHGDPIETDKTIPLNEEAAAQFIQQTLSTLTLYSDDTLSFTLPQAVPIDPESATRLTITLNAHFSPEAGVSSTQRLLDRTTDWTGGEVFKEKLDTTQGELTGVMLRVAFMTETGTNRYHEYSANYVELTPPFTYDTPAIVQQSTVQVTMDGQEAALLYTLQNSSQLGISLTLPAGLTLASAKDYPEYAPEATYAAMPPTFVAVLSGKPIGTLHLYNLATADTDSLAGVDTSADNLPMEVFATTALSNHAGYENYTVRRFSDTGASATALYVWQDLGGQTVSAAEVPWKQADCVLAYDWGVTPYFMELILGDSVFSADELTATAKSVSVSAVD